MHDLVPFQLFIWNPKRKVFKVLSLQFGKLVEPQKCVTLVRFNYTRNYPFIHLSISELIYY